MMAARPAFERRVLWALDAQPSRIPVLVAAATGPVGWTTVARCVSSKVALT